LFFSCSSNDTDDIYQQQVEVADINLSYSAIEAEITTLINEYRIENELASLNILNIISYKAGTHSEYMAEIGEANHDNFNERYQYLVENASAVKASENVAFGYRSAQGVVNAWLNSPSHKEIIIDPTFTDFGIATKMDSDGNYYFTNIFIKK
jgi:uncharacterized protein YkwD